MGRSPCCDKVGVKKGPWTPEEDIMLVSYVQEHGPGNWRAVPTITGLRRCSKSCRLRWANYLRPGIKRGNFTDHEEKMIIRLQDLLGNKWAAIASFLPERTDNDIKNYWNIHLKKKLKKVQEPAVPNGFINPRGQWETRLQADIHAAKQALEDALSYENTIQGFTYASSTENIARLLKHWNPPKSEQSSISSTTTQNSFVNNPTSSSNSAEVQAETKPDTTPLSMLENWLLDESTISGTDLLFDENSQLF